MICPVDPDEDFNVFFVVFAVIVAGVLTLTSFNRQGKLDSSNMSEKPNSSKKER